jgi:hypothetical protein
MLNQRAFKEELRILSSISNRPICVLCHNFEPIEVQTSSAPQNDRLNLSFVKVIYVHAETWLEMVNKWPFWRAGGGGYQ